VLTQVRLKESYSRACRPTKEIIRSNEEHAPGFGQERSLAAILSILVFAVSLRAVRCWAA
jgi:hypothetical protein